MINDSDPKKLIKSLCDEINRHNKLYYVDAKPQISDKDFDNLLTKLEALENKFPQFKSESSPTQRVGGKPLDEFNSIKHSIPMQSLSNTYNKEELFKFDERIRKLIDESECEYIIEPKIDGVAISIRYENGNLKYAVTRGDGITGDDVTENIKTIKSIPLKLLGDNVPSILEIRGEIFLNKNKFEDLNKKRIKEGKEPFANPRNACAGSLKLLDPKEVSKRPLDAIFYNLGEHTLDKIDTHFNLLEKLKKYGIKVSPFYEKIKKFDLLLKNLDKLQNLSNQFPFEIDGAVIKVNKLSFHSILGKTSKSPRWAVAYKYESEQAITRLNAISIQVGRTGVLTPVAELESVQLAGTLVKRATLHNYDEIIRKDIRVGDYVIIEKAGEIIPIVLKVILEKRKQNLKKFEFPKFCPSCSTPIHKNDEEVAIRCNNNRCPSKLKNWITHFASRKAMDITGLGESVVEQLIKNKLIQSPPDIYELKLSDLINLERFGEKSAQNLINNINDSKKISFGRVLYALGIPHVGKTASETIANYYQNINSIFLTSIEELEEIDDVGPIVAKSIEAYFSNPEYQLVIQRLKNYGIKFEIEYVQSDETLKGQTFVFTGTLPNLSRNEASEKIELRGGKISSNISKKTNYLIAGEAAGSKLDKARDLGIKVLNESEFMKLINN
ncbi:MAG: NAD-dependent DNA ligase LigA [Verrucomicrobiota bacterium]|nr:NAD-dependent DNA ligase LigA [Verrucomicrobiota bacterium]